jgi:DNA-binding NarL/FixJ family response regulator
MTESPRGGTGTARILIVDDEPLNVEYLEQELEALGFTTETAADGLDALDRIAADAPDLVLLDVMMPELDGIAVLRILKDDPETRLIPVVLMTALNAVEDRVRGIEAGADDFLSKPVDERELLARIRTALTQKHVIDETIDELRSTSAHLERHGRHERDVAVLAVDWHVEAESVPAVAARFAGRTSRRRAEERIRVLGGTPSERPDAILIAVFEGSNLAGRATAAVDAALAVLAENTAAPAAGPTAPGIAAAVSAGTARIGSTRIGVAGSSRWVFAAEGDPVDRASELVRHARGPGLLVTREVGTALSGSHTLEPAEDPVAYRVLARDRGTREDRPEGGGDRRIRTLLVTDIVDSTGTVERLGDRAWSTAVAAQEEAIRTEVVRSGGEEIDTSGDGFLASFESPADAIRCALASVERVASLGLAIRAGIHTGEVEAVAGRLRGIAVHLATRIADEADPGEVLVSATARELAAGAGLAFSDRAEHVLKGVSEPRTLYAAAEAARDDGRAPDPRTERADGATEYPAGLTAREVDVLRLVASGLSDAETARRLVLSVRTVHAHLRSIYRKLGVHSRAAARRFAEEHSLL